MERSNDQDPHEEPAPNLPVTARNFTTQDLEAVIRRAVELQAGSAARAEDGLSEIDVVRIGQELGLEPATVRRAMAEVRHHPVEEQGALIRVAGGGAVRVARVLRFPAPKTGALLDRYLRETEHMVARRRFPDRTRYVRDTSLAAGMARFVGGFSRSHKPLNLKELDVAVSFIDAESCWVEISVDLAEIRGGLVAGVLGSGGAVAAGWTVTVWATAIADPLMLLGVPVLAGSWYGMRAIYRTISKSVQEKLESLLDRVEHNELTS
ncbi:MAG TPA: hypothetical protein VFO52_12165 [Longimicrobiales bacterium]|nr:hypothetical protein [Longimicrobiales bacterium]